MMKNRIISLVLLVLAVACGKGEGNANPVHDPTGKFVVVKGTQLYQADGSSFTIKGVNLNHWLTPESYMFGLKNISVTETDKAFRQMLGDEYMNSWWKRFMENYFTLDDFLYLNSIGANTVRMPLTYKMFNDTFYLCDNSPEMGFEFIDRVVSWCKEAGLYLILDMHVAPGGQSGAPHIDDSDGYPKLFESEENMEEFCRIWKKIATRYADEPIILGYELLNEPIKKEYERLYTYLQPTFEKAAAAIREVDKNHILIIGGANFYDDFTPLTNLAFDSKILMTRHRYGSTVVKGDAELRDKYGLPIFIGEFGHWNGGTDMTAQIVSNMKSSGIGYTYWPFKKMDNWESLLGFDTPEGWQQISAFVSAQRDTPVQIQIALGNIDVEKARKAMEDYLENCLFRNCFERAEVKEGLQFK